MEIDYPLILLTNSIPIQENIVSIGIIAQLRVSTITSFSIYL